MRVIHAKKCVTSAKSGCNVYSTNVFGVQLDGRNFSSTAYRYGFNGMEKDDEIKGSGNSYDFGARLMDTRLGRWLTLDGKAVDYPGWSPYCFALDNPIKLLDPDGHAVTDEQALQKLGKLSAPELNAKIEEQWKKSFTRPDKSTGNERGFNILQDETGKAYAGNIQVGAPNTNGKAVAIQINDPVLKEGEQWLASIHTHPYFSTEQGYRPLEAPTWEGVPHSPEDIYKIKGKEEGFTILVEAGNKRFALVIQDATKANEFLSKFSQQEFVSLFYAGQAEPERTGALPEKSVSTIVDMIGSDNGIGFYEANDSKDNQDWTKINVSGGSRVEQIKAFRDKRAKDNADKNKKSTTTTTPAPTN